MRRSPKLRLLLCLLLAGTALAGAWRLHRATLAGGGLDAGEARAAIRRWLGANDEVQVKEVNALGNSAVVVANVEAVFRFAKGEGGRWRVAEIRRGNNRWDDVTALERTLQEEKSARARAELEILSQALESFRRERGFYVQAKSVAALVDHLSPFYLKHIVRVDPWHKPYEYESDGARFVLSSRGADGKKGTADDIAARP
jgi:hypothetical protein